MAAVSAADAYTYDDFDDGTARLQATQQQGAELRRFLESFSDELRGVEEALADALSKSAFPLSEPIAIDLTPREHTTVLQLAQTANKPLNKIMSLFAFLIVELRELRRIGEARFFGPLGMFGTQLKEEETREGDAQVAVGRALPLLSELSNYVARVYVVVCNAVRQLACLYHPSQQLYANFAKGVHVAPVWAALALTLTHLATLDELLAGNVPLASAWARYVAMMRPVTRDPARFGAKEDDVRRFDKLVKALSSALFERGAVLRGCLSQSFDLADVVEVRGNKVLRRVWSEALRDMLARISANVGGADETDERSMIPGFYALLALHVSLWHGEGLDRRFLRDAVELCKRVPVVPLWTNRVWWVPDFVAQALPALAASAGRGAFDPRKIKREHLTLLKKTFQHFVSEYSGHVGVWMARFESNPTNRSTLRQAIDLKIRLIREGVYLAHQVSYTYRTIVALHSELQAQLSVTELRALCHCIVLLKAIHETFRRRMPVIAESSSLICQRICHSLLRALDPVRRDLEQGSRISQANLDVLAAATMAVSMLRGCSTRERRTVLRLAIAVAEQHPQIRQQIGEISIALNRLDIAADLSDIVDSACNCAFLYASREMIPHQFSMVFSTPRLAPTLQYLLCALDDATPLLRSSVHFDGAEIASRYRTEVLGELRRCIVEPLERAIDEDLRLSTHTHLRVADRNPMRDGVPEIVRLLALRPLVFAGECVDLRALVAHHLDHTFYDTNTVALFDWRTYEEMRNLARTKYGLPMTDAYLPSQTLEQGMDVLEIMRGIHVFVANYNYDMNTQFFIERQSESKTLNTIGIANIANSIRTHGTGIMNTTVNFTYQFLKTMFTSFSQFLFDEHIKGRLMKEIKWFRDHKEETHLHYPFDRAERFNKDIRKLGTAGEGNASFLDRFRILVTQIGNAMGYIRMIRSGGLLACANAMRFVPDLQNIAQFEELVTQERLSPESVAAAKTVDLAVGNLAQSFKGGFEYFALLVQVFATEFRSAENHHLKNFYSIIPALSLNFVEHILSAKEKIAKKASQLHADGYVFCDDGFAVGIAYILRLLDQVADFDALHWFDAARQHYAEQAQQLERAAAARASGRKAKEQQQTTVLNLRKVRAYQAEFDLLRFSFAGAKIFFDN